jgi:hypothetical protein
MQNYSTLCDYLRHAASLFLRAMHGEYEERVEYDEQQQRQEHVNDAGEPIEYRAVGIELAQVGQFNPDTPGHLEHVDTFGDQ